MEQSESLDEEGQGVKESEPIVPRMWEEHVAIFGDSARAARGRSVISDDGQAEGTSAGPTHLASDYLYGFEGREFEEAGHHRSFAPAYGRHHVVEWRGSGDSGS